MEFDKFSNGDPQDWHPKSLIAEERIERDRVFMRTTGKLDDGTSLRTVVYARKGFRRLAAELLERSEITRRTQGI